MVPRSTRLSGLHFTLDEAALRLGVPEQQVRTWLSQFRWERHFDGSGHLLLGEKDMEFLRLLRSLKDVDVTCDSITRLIEGEPQPAVAEAPQPAVAAGPSTGREQVETLKEALRDLHQSRPFWRFWQRITLR